MLDFTSGLSAIDFDVAVDDVFDRDGKRINPDFGRGVYRTDTGQLLSICGPHYRPVQHRDVVAPVIDTLVDKGYDVVERVGNKSSLYDLAGKKGAFVSVSTTDNGAVLRADVITGDFIQPTGHSAYLDRGPDTMLHQHVLLNSHNSKLAATATSRYCRLVCMNGILKPSFSSRAYGKHTLNFDVSAFRKQVLVAATTMEDDAALFGLYASTRLSAKQAEQFVKATLAKLPNKPNGDENFSDQLTNQILRLFQQEDQTVWGLVQAFTYWATHEDMKGNSDPITGRLGRDARVATALRTPQFKALLEGTAN